MAQKEVAAGAQRPPESTDDCPDCLRAEVDHHIAAEDDIAAGGSILRVGVGFALQIQEREASQ